MTRRLLLATRNPGKLRELRAMFAAAGLEIIDLDEAGIAESDEESLLEAHPTFEENALAKARHFHRLSGLPTVADDSGIAVDALGGAPGVHSKRWSDDSRLAGLELDAANNAKLVRAMAKAEDRRAGYVCAAAYVDEERELVRRGEVRGEITREARGSGGFGYDPYFFSHELARTFGEASMKEKQRVSHRGRAFSALITEVSRGYGRS